MINKVILIGNVGTDPEIRTLESGVKVARVRLATTERIYNRQSQEARDHTEWHTVTLWRNLADTADRFVKKGSQIYIEGKIRSNEWTDQSGAKRYGIEILADDMKLLGRRSDSPGAAGPASERQSPGAYGTFAGGSAPATPAAQE
ncbi:MAG: single-stranded DNA-binding protein, partial [Alistipes sp.]|nr:single-stranded DNA-binding protein [Alistipes sp.]